MSNVRVTVKYFARTREVAGATGETVELPGGSTVAVLARHLSRRYGRVWDSLPLLYAVNQEHADENTILNDGDEVGILYPASGG